MKVAVSATGEGLESQVDVRFGRCPNFVIVDIENGRIKGSKNLENRAVDQMGGAGITSAQIVADEGVKAVITVNMGPRAFAVFQQLGIKVYKGFGKVRNVIEAFARDELEEISEATGPNFVGKEE